jgi:parallel beta-helix repeat protein
MVLAIAVLGVIVPLVTWGVMSNSKSLQSRGSIPVSFIVSTDGTSYYAVNYTSGLMLDQSTSPYRVIGNAIGNLTNGGMIFVRNGYYVESGNFSWTLNANTTIIGESMEQTIIGSSDGQATFFIQTDNCRISNLKLTRKNPSLNVGSHLAIYNSTSVVNNVEIDHVHFVGDANTGAIYLLNVTKANIHDNICDSASIGNFVYSAGELNQSRIVQNTVSDCFNEGIYSRGGQDVLISNNTLTNCTSTENLQFISLQNNYPSKNFVVEGNMFRFTSTSAQKNTAGLTVGGESTGSNYQDNVVVVGNVFVVDSAVANNLTALIWCHGYNSTNHTVRNVTISRNTLLGYGNYSYGIVLTMTEQYHVIGNNITRTGKSAIYIADANNGLVTSNIINGYDIGGQGYDPIRLTISWVNCTIYDNWIS